MLLSGALVLTLPPILQYASEMSVTPNPHDHFLKIILISLENYFHISGKKRDYDKCLFSCWMFGLLTRKAAVKTQAQVTLQTLRFSWEKTWSCTFVGVCLLCWNIAETRGVAQWVKCSLGQHEDLRPNTQHPHINWACNPAPRGRDMETGRFSELAASQSNQLVSSRLVGDPASKTKVKGQGDGWVDKGACSSTWIGWPELDP